MLSFLARSQSNFHLAGTCPQPSRKSTVFEPQFFDGKTYLTAYHYNSEMEGHHVFGTTREANELNCLRLHFLRDANLQPAVGLDDCDNYEGSLSFSETQSTYNLTMQNVDTESSCSNRTVQIERLYIWAAKDHSVIVFWNCQNDTKLRSHKEVVVTFVNQAFLDSKYHQERSAVVANAEYFTGQMVNFSNIKVNEFVVNTQIRDFRNQTCNLNCSSTCELQVQENSFGGSIIFFVVIGFLVIIVFVMFI